MSNVLVRMGYGWFLALSCVCSSLWVPVAMASPPDLYVLAIGVSRYQDTDIPPLAYADDDARALVQWADSQKGKVYRDVHTRLLVERQATRRDIISALVEFLKPAAPQDQVILFLGGHGVVESETGAYHFLTYDTDHDSIAGTALEQDDILKKLETGQRKHDRVLVLMDTCQSGALADALPQEGRGMFVASDAPALKDEQVRARESLWAIFTAGTASDKAMEGPQYRFPDEPENNRGHGLFTWAVLKALGTTEADISRNGIISFTEFTAFVTRLVKEESKGNQLPVVSGKQTDIALAFAVGTPELCDGQDNNLNGTVDEGFRDDNHNGVADCLDKEICNGRDDNGDGRVDEGFDRDGDLHLSIALCGSRIGDDCNDADISMHPDQKDWANLRDDDCDGLFDEDDARIEGIPRSLNTRWTELKVERTLSWGLGASLFLAGLGFYATLPSLSPQANDVESPGLNDALYVRNSRLSVVLASAGVLGLSLGARFQFKLHRFEVEILPRDRRAVPEPAALSTAASPEQ